MKAHPRAYATIAENEHGFDLICSLCHTVILKNIPDKRTAFTNCGSVIEHAAVCAESEVAEVSNTVQTRMSVVCA